MAKYITTTTYEVSTTEFGEATYLEFVSDAKLAFTGNFFAETLEVERVLKTSTNPFEDLRKVRKYYPFKADTLAFLEKIPFEIAVPSDTWYDGGSKHPFDDYLIDCFEYSQGEVKASELYTSPLDQSGFVKRLDHKLPTSIAYWTESTTLASNSIMVDAAQEHLDKHPWVLSTEVVDVPYYNQSLLGRKQLQIVYRLPQKFHDKLIPALKDESHFALEETLFYSLGSEAALALFEGKYGFSIDAFDIAQFRGEFRDYDEEDD